MIPNLALATCGSVTTGISDANRRITIGFQVMANSTANLLNADSFVLKSAYVAILLKLEKLTRKNGITIAAVSTDMYLLNPMAVSVSHIAKPHDKAKKPDPTYTPYLPP